MGRRAEEPLRAMTGDERKYLEQMSRASSAPAVQVGRAKLLPHVGVGYEAAANAEGQRSGEAVAQLVRRFDQEGLEALEPRHGGGPQRVDGATARERILAEM
jgi:hypothetical protein